MRLTVGRVVLRTLTYTGFGLQGPTKRLEEFHSKRQKAVKNKMGRVRKSQKLGRMTPPMFREVKSPDFFTFEQVVLC